MIFQQAISLNLSESRNVLDMESDKLEINLVPRDLSCRYLFTHDFECPMGAGQELWVQSKISEPFMSLAHNTWNPDSPSMCH